MPWEPDFHEGGAYATSGFVAWFADGNVLIFFTLNKGWKHDEASMAC